jgi:hypothetical protein
MQSSLLSTLKYFPLAGFIIKWIMDVATSDSMIAISSIIQDSCITLYLVCILGFLISPNVTNLPKFGIFVICLLLGLYLSSIILNAEYITLIDTTNVDDIKPASASFWILSEIVILMTFMTSYVSSIISTPMAFSNTWLLGLLIIMIPHAIIVYTNFGKMNMGPTDDATRNIKPMD